MTLILLTKIKNSDCNPILLLCTQIVISYFSNKNLLKNMILNLTSFFINTLSIFSDLVEVKGLNNMIVLGIFLLILQIMDIVTTNIGIKRGCVEGNPLIKNSLESGFPLHLVIIKIGLASLLTFFLSLGITILNWLFLALDLFLFAIVTNNIIGIHFQKKWNRIYNIEIGNLMKFTQVMVVRDWIALTQKS